MKKDGKSVSAILHIKVEAPSVISESYQSYNDSHSANLKLIHQLQVHQIELEMQNNELALAKERAEVAAQKYAEIYDFAAASHFTLSKDGEIIDLNNFGSQMLGRETRKLINSRFGFFVSEDTRPAFNRFINKLFTDKTKESCEVTLSAQNNVFKYVQLCGIVGGKGEYCLVSVTDITDLKKAEIELNHLKKGLEAEVLLRTDELRRTNLRLAQELNKRLANQKKLKQSLHEYRQLYNYLHKVREDERVSIARIIHDDIAQLLTTMKLELTYWKVNAEKPDLNTDENINSLLLLVEKSITAISLIITDLRPVILDKLGLIPALIQLFSGFQQHTGIVCDNRLLEDTFPVKTEAALVIYQVLVEVMANIRNHSKASYVTVKMASNPSAFSITVNDNGKGITSEELSNPNSFGIIGMKERIHGLKGQITFTGSIGKGTKILLKVPVKE